jgi:hypothetical protein
VLFAESLGPAIIDVAPYWRPPEYAAAVVVADAIAWHDARPGLVGHLPGTDDDKRSMLARAAIYRLLTADRMLAGRPDRSARDVHDEMVAHRRILGAIRAELS